MILSKNGCLSFVKLTNLTCSNHAHLQDFGVKTFLACNSTEKSVNWRMPLLPLELASGASSGDLPLVMPEASPEVARQDRSEGARRNLPVNGDSVGETKKSVEIQIKTA